MTILVKSGTGELRFQAKKGENLLEALLKNGVVLPHPCHGKGKCAKCRVGIIVLNERSSSGTLHEKATNRLACLTEIREPLLVILPSKGRLSESKTGTTLQNKPTAGIGESKTGIAQLNVPTAELGESKTGRKQKEKVGTKTTPPSRRRSVLIPARAPSDHSLWERLVGAFDGKDRKVLEHAMESVLPGLRELVSDEGGPITMVRSGRRLFGLHKGEEKGKRFGLACHFRDDTLSGVLADLREGRTDWSVTVRFQGTDRGAHVAILQEIVSELCSRAGCTSADVTDVALAARIPVIEMLAGMSDSAEGTTGALPAVLGARLVGSERIGIQLAPHAVVYLPPSRSATCGPDCVMGNLAGDANPLGVMAGTLACLMHADSRKAAEKRG